MGTLYKYWDFIAHFYLLGRYLDNEHLRRRKAKTFELHWKVFQSFLINFIILYLISITKHVTFLNDDFSFETPHGAVVLIILLTLYFSLNAFLAYALGLIALFVTVFPSMKNDIRVFKRKLKTLKLVGFRKAPKSAFQTFKPILLLMLFMLFWVGVILTNHYLHAHLKPMQRQ